jgi:Spy/CpxP family protein refolding chaperone
MDANRSNRKAFLLVLVVFVLGIGLGAVGAYLVGGRVSSAQPVAENHRDKRARILEQLTRDLSLTPDQRKQLEAILADVGAKFQALHQQMAPQSEQVRKQGREQIRAILTPEQRPKFEEFLRKLDEERKKRSER